MPSRRCMVQHTLPRTVAEVCDRIEVNQIVAIGHFMDIVENTCQIEDEFQNDIYDIGHIIDKYAQVQQYRAHTKGKNNGQDQYRNDQEEMPVHPDPVKQQQSERDAQTDKHLEAIYHHIGDDQHEFRQIYFRYDRLVPAHHFYGCLNAAAEEIPDRQTDKDVAVIIFHLPVQHISEYKGVDEHEAQRLQDPPQPVQVGIGYFRL